MNKIWILLVLNCVMYIAPIHSQSTERADISSQWESRIEQMSVTEKINHLELIHKRIFELPYEYSYIKSTIMGELIEFREQNLSNFPDREKTGTDMERVMQAFSEWIQNHPGEYRLYVGKGYQLINKYQQR